MQFTGLSLPVHQSMSVPWEFFYLVPFHQPISAHAISSLNCHQNVSPPSGASPWNGIFGRVEGQNTTYGPNPVGELPEFFRRIESYVTSFGRVILVEDWYTVLDPNLDREGSSSGTNNLDARHFPEFVERHDLVETFRERYPNKLEWTWTSRSTSAQLYSYLGRVLAR